MMIVSLKIKLMKGGWSIECVMTMQQCNHDIQLVASTLKWTDMSYNKDDYFEDPVLPGKQS